MFNNLESIKELSSKGILLNKSIQPHFIKIKNYKECFIIPVNQLEDGIIINIEDYLVLLHRLHVELYIKLDELVATISKEQIRHLTNSNILCKGFPSFFIELDTQGIYSDIYINPLHSKRKFSLKIKPIAVFQLVIQSSGLYLKK